MNSQANEAIFAAPFLIGTPRLVRAAARGPKLS